MLFFIYFTIRVYLLKNFGILVTALLKNFGKFQTVLLKKKLP